MSKIWTEQDWAVAWAAPTPQAYLADPRGGNGKAYEVVTRQWLRRNSAVTTVVHEIGKQGKPDAWVTRKTPDGRVVKTTLEIKTNCGDVTDIRVSKYIAYCPTAGTSDITCDTLRVFTTEEFWELLENYPKTSTRKNPGSAFRVTEETLPSGKVRTHYHIQSFWTPTARQGSSKTLYRYLMKAWSEHPTLAEWEQMLVQGLIK